MNPETITAIFENATPEQIDALMRLHSADTAALSEELGALKADLEKRDAQAQADDRREAMNRRMEAALGKRRFVHARLREVILADFTEAVQSECNAGKTDEEILDALTLGQNCFECMHPPVGSMSRFGHVPSESDAALRRAFGLPARA